VGAQVLVAAQAVVLLNGVVRGEVVLATVAQETPPVGRFSALVVEQVEGGFRRHLLPSQVGIAPHTPATATAVAGVAVRLELRVARGFSFPTAQAKVVRVVERLQAQQAEQAVQAAQAVAAAVAAAPRSTATTPAQAATAAQATPASTRGERHETRNRSRRNRRQRGAGRA
jgi:ribosomal protein L12E/L44/L45/RPP1/RPP2